MVLLNFGSKAFYDYPIQGIVTTMLMVRKAMRRACIRTTGNETRCMRGRSVLIGSSRLGVTYARDLNWACPDPFPTFQNTSFCLTRSQKAEKLSKVFIEHKCSTNRAFSLVFIIFTSDRFSRNFFRTNLAHFNEARKVARIFQPEKIS